MSRVSVVVPTYNCERFITAAIDSALGQTQPPDEIIVVDDGSTDNTEQVLGKYGDRVTYIRRPNSGGYPSVVRNAGIEAANGDYIAFLDADDVWYPAKLAEQVAMLDQRPDVVMVYSDYDRIDEDGNVIVGESYTRPCAIDKGRLVSTEDYWEDVFCQLSLRCFMFTSTVVARKQALDQAGRFDPDLLYHEDHDLWLRVAYAGRIERIPAIHASYRVRASSNTHTRREMLIRDTKALYAKALKLVENDPKRRAFVRRAAKLVIASAFVTSAYESTGISGLRRSLLLIQAMIYDPLLVRNEQHVWKRAVKYALGMAR